MSAKKVLLSANEAVARGAAQAGCIVASAYPGTPSTGWWGTIGFAEFRTFADRAELSLAAGNDFFFPNPLKAGERRPPEWDDIVAEETGSKTVFRYDR